jgi:hypothetical protein
MKKLAREESGYYKNKKKGHTNTSNSPNRNQKERTKMGNTSPKKKKEIKLTYNLSFEKIITKKKDGTAEKKELRVIFLLFFFYF